MATAPHTEPRTPDQIRQDIDEAREQLGETVQQLVARTDVRRQATEKAQAVRERLDPVPPSAVAGLLAGLLLGRLIWRRR